MCRSSALQIGGLVLLFVVAVTPLATAQRVTLHVHDDRFELTGTGEPISIGELVSLFSPHLDTVFVIDTDVAPRTVVVFGRSDIPADLLLSYLETLLVGREVAIEPVGPPGAGLHRVTRLERRRPTTVASEADLEALRLREGERVTTVIELKFASPTAVASALRRILGSSAGRAVVAVESSRRLLVSAFGLEVWMIGHVARALDQGVAPDVKRFASIPLARQNANELARALNELVDDRDAVTAPRIAAERRSNSLIVHATAIDLEGILRLATMLDSRPDGGPDRLRVHRLRHALAEEMEAVLRDLFGLEPSGRESREGGDDRSNRFDDDGVESRAGDDNDRDQDASRRRREEPSRRSSSTSGSIAEDEVIRVVADVPSNAIVVLATDRRHTEIEALIRDLDRPRRSIFVEIAVVELTDRELEEIGIELSAADGAGRLFGSTAFGLSTLANEAAGSIADVMRLPDLAARGLTAGMMGPFSGVPLILRVFGEDMKSSLVSVSSILVDENRTGSLRLAREVATLRDTEFVPRAVDDNFGNPTPQPFNPNDISRTSEFDEYHAAETRFDVTPFLAKGDALRLEVSLVIQEFTGEQSNAMAPPPRSGRSVSTSVTLKNGETAFLGGLNVDRNVKTKQKVPLLGDLPVVGELFTSRRSESEESRLYVFATPVACSIPKADVMPGMKNIPSNVKRRARVK